MGSWKKLLAVASGCLKPPARALVPGLHPFETAVVCCWPPEAVVLPVVERLWGVGPATAAKLHEHHLTTVGQVAQLPEAGLISNTASPTRAARSRAGVGHRWGQVLNPTATPPEYDFTFHFK